MKSVFYNIHCGASRHNPDLLPFETRARTGAILRKHSQVLGLKFWEICSLKLITLFRTHFGSLCKNRGFAYHESQNMCKLPVFIVK